MRNNAAKKILSIILAITVIAGLIPFTSVTHTKAAEEILSTDDFQYKKIGNSYIQILNCINTTAEEIRIPEEIDGCPVKILGRNFSGSNTSEFVFSDLNANLKKIYISKNISQICENTFQKIKKVEFISVDENNANFCSDSNGFLYSKKGDGSINSILRCPPAYAADELTISDSVYKIDSFAFSFCSKIKRIVIPDSVKDISYAFNSCTSLESIQFPDSVGYLNCYFSDCPSLLSIKFPTALSVSGQYSNFSGCTSLKSVILPKCSKLYSVGQAMFKNCTALESVDFQNSVNKIRPEAFMNCSSLTTFSGDAEIQEISSQAFSGCSSLTAVPGNNKLRVISQLAFENCTSLKSVPSLDNLEKIGVRAFGGCSNLLSVGELNSLKAIMYDAFKNCTVLSSISLPDHDIEIQYDVFAGTALVADESRYTDGSLYIGKHLIATLPNIETLAVKEGTLTIGNSACYQQQNLHNVSIPDSLIRISDKSFMNCKALNEINLPEQLKYIDHAAFSGSGLNKIYIPQNVVALGSNCFENCNKLSEISISNTDTEINKYCFKGTALSSISLPKTSIIDEYTFFNCTKLESIYIPDGTAQINVFAFSLCRNLQQAYLPDSITCIEAKVFEGCQSLKEITIPQKITEIDYGTFNNCKALSCVNLPKGLISINGLAFAGCESLTSIAIPKSVKSIGASAFSSYLKTVYFEGSEEEWNAITFGANNTPLEQAEIIFNSTGATVPDKPKDNITWSFDSSDGHLFLSGSGDMLEREKTSDYEWYGFRNSIKSLTIGEGVTSVGANAFTGFVNLGEIIVGKDVKKIGDNAFAGCAKLSLISFVGEPSEISSSAFVGCNKRMTVIGENDLGKAFAQSNGFNYNPISYDSEKKVLNFGNTLTIYKDLPYTFIVYYVVKYSQSEYLHFDKLIFDGVIGDTISMDNVDKSAEYLTLNNLYVSLKSTDGEQISFARMLELLEDGEYDAFKYVVKDDKNPEQEEKPKPEKKDFFEKIAEGLENLYTNALKTLSKVANFFRKLFK